MRLSVRDKEYLKKCGYLESDFLQIERAIRKTIYTFDGEVIAAEEAIRLLGKEEFLSGLARSAFHGSSSREVGIGGEVYFDSSRLFL